MYGNSPQGVQTGDSKHREVVESMAMSAEYHHVPYVRFFLHLEFGKNWQLGDGIYKILSNGCPPEHKACEIRETDDVPRRIAKQQLPI